MAGWGVDERAIIVEKQRLKLRKLLRDDTLFQTLVRQSIETGGLMDTSDHSSSGWGVPHPPAHPPPPAGATPDDNDYDNDGDGAPVPPESDAQQHGDSGREGVASQGAPLASTTTPPRDGAPSSRGTTGGSSAVRTGKAAITTPASSKSLKVRAHQSL